MKIYFAIGVMVLQQNSDVAIWGWGTPGEEIIIVCSWNKNDMVTVKPANTAKWEGTIRKTKAGSPYSISISGNDTVEIKNVMLGEVWLCSGQSNMEWSINWGITNEKELLTEGFDLDIRILTVQKQTDEFPQQNCLGSWQLGTAEHARSTSAVGYIFAKELKRKLNVPVGIIVSAWGGTTAEVWIEKNRINNKPKLDEAKIVRDVFWCPSEPGAAYNSMIHPSIPYGIKGAIWYQGESSLHNYWVYSLLMKNLIEGWRSDFKKEFPFFLVRIAPFAYEEANISAYLREQQELTTKVIPKTGMIVISDLVDDINNVHPQNKIDVGKRLANYALTETYGLEVGAYKSPTYGSIEIIRNEIKIDFNDVITELVCKDEQPFDFQISGEDKYFVPAKVRIDGKSILVYSKSVKNPVAVRHCFDDISIPNVFSKEGLPLAPFRTDKWQLKH
ncbi:sialate O-acetylesterase [uncultured Sunxiuqinia sp.]|uniref:sialate O-acetylesterase n=1 Tax=uncultured Sunxiuqinia sp. TaxID=1573825 RepID=UPI002AA7B684|nr:sialate O-acetylesterase [uncultured Sunxiuqinia sp.]